MGWYTLAYELGIPSIGVLQRSITSTEFVEWMYFLKEKRKEQKPEYIYLAQILQSISNMFSKSPKSTDKYMIDLDLFYDGKKKEKKNILSTEERLRNIKQAVMGRFFSKHIK